MASALKVLGQEKPAATVLTDLDTVPADSFHVISSLVICNQDTVNDDSFRVSVAVAGAADSPEQYLYFDQPVNAGDTFIATIGITLAETDVLRVRSTNGDCSFNAFGTEES